MKSRGAFYSLVIAVWIASLGAGLAQAQTTATRNETLEQEFSDPLTTLPQVFFKDSWSPATYGTHLETNTAVLRAIIPRIPSNTLLPFVQLVRPTFTLVTVPSSRGGSRTELGDTQLFDIAVLPWPGKGSGLAVGVGPTFVFPTATSMSAGQGAWQVGPTLAAGYTGIPWLLGGFLLQNPVSFAYTNPHRVPLNTLEFQPVLLVHLFRGWYLRSADATWQMGWRRHNPTQIPVSVGLGRVMVRPGLPPVNFYVAAQWMAYRQFAPIVPQTSVVFGITVAYPKLVDW